jgi:ribose/xylose/arabinose/galactoside ABC-type transport system permease subunit
MKLRLTRSNIPVLATALVLLALYATASVLYWDRNFCSVEAAANLLRNYAFLGIAAIGMTFVILSGGIDLSVGSMIGLTSITVAMLIDNAHLHPCLAWLIALAMGTVGGAFMGALIHYYRMPAFLVTLGGMFFARGAAFMVNDLSQGISPDIYDPMLGGVTLHLPGGAVIPPSSLLFLLLLGIALVVARRTRFGRNVYAIGGDEQSALLMGLPIARTRIGVYTISGVLAALAGVVTTFTMTSGDPARGVGRELDAIAVVVIGGTLLSGGVGGVFGTFLGVLIFGTIKTALDYDGRLDSSLLRVVIGLILLGFILLQKLISRPRAGKAQSDQ